ncbi:MAG TPA: response regulator [Bryobacteraceae bacterium]|jgi:CheY-like chemotaxis protein|nr:response regulator [Bryobacteraceae bacterium]
MARILLVEDNEMNRDMLSRRLIRRGYEVTLAMDGQDGLNKALSPPDLIPPDLILMDMSLPGIDGWEATRRLKALPLTARIPVIALTAHALTDDREKATRAGCDAFATKPVEFQPLIETIERLLRNRTTL